MTPSAAEPRRQRPTIRAVADAAGVAPSTVSRYLNGKLAIATDTEERITRALTEVGYERRHTPRPGPSAPTTVIAIVVPHVDIAYFADLAERVCASAERIGMECVIYTTGSGGFGVSGLVERLIALPIDGVIFAGTDRMNHALDRLIAASVPVVTLGEPVRGHQLDKIRVDYRSAAHQAVAYLASAGHRQIGLISGPAWLPSHDDIQKGFDEAMRQSGLSPREALQLSGDIDRDFGYAALSQLMLTSDRPTALFVSADEIALGVYSAARDLGIELPDQLSIVGSDDIPFARFLTPTLTTVRVPRDRMADRAVQVLWRRIHEDNAFGATDSILPVSLQVRGSVAPITDS